MVRSISERTQGVECGFGMDKPRRRDTCDEALVNSSGNRQHPEVLSHPVRYVGDRGKPGKSGWLD